MSQRRALELKRRNKVKVFVKEHIYDLESDIYWFAKDHQIVQISYARDSKCHTCIVLYKEGEKENGRKEEVR